MPVLVTGGAGFIGAHLARRLLDAGIETVILDAFQHVRGPITDSSFGTELAYRSRLMAGAKVIRADIRQPSEVDAIVERVRPEVIVHLAATALVPVAEAHPIETQETIVAGTGNLLVAARRCSSVDRFVYVSSSMAYGDFAASGADEDHPTQPMNIYGGLKLAGETITRAYLARGRARPVIVRPSGVYGPGDLGGRVVQSFCEGALAGRPLRLSAHGDSAIDFTWVRDLADGLYLAATRPNAADETFNLTYGNARTLDDLIAILRAQVPDLVVEFGSEDAPRPKRGSLDIGKARRLLGYAPSVTLERGVRQYLSHFAASHPDWPRFRPAQLHTVSGVG
ncbi:MAG: NAD(P)-dependent oxidoreductase [Phenylobacterium sp.]|nr:NAD(P)-dependent oxidoreductase [Phenylobacterium sp.]